MPKRTRSSNRAANNQPVLSDGRYARLLDDVQRLITTTRIATDRQRVTAHWNLGRRIARERLHEQAGYHNSILRDLSVGTGMATRTPKPSSSKPNARIRTAATSLTSSTARKT